jgi:hypothetical protein
VKIVKKWNGVRAPITRDFLEEFRTWLIQKKIDQEKQRQKILNKNQIIITILNIILGLSI